MLMRLAIPSLLFLLIANAVLAQSAVVFRGPIGGPEERLQLRRFAALSALIRTCVGEAGNDGEIVLRLGQTTQVTRADVGDRACLERVHVDGLVSAHDLWWSWRPTQHALIGRQTISHDYTGPEGGPIVRRTASAFELRGTPSDAVRAWVERLLPSMLSCVPERRNDWQQQAWVVLEIRAGARAQSEVHAFGQSRQLEACMERAARTLADSPRLEADEHLAFDLGVQDQTELIEP